MNSVPSRENPALGIPSPGELLYAKREEFGWSRRDVARELHLSERQIEAIEQDDYDGLPGKTYVMGYWRSYAQLLEMDIENSIQVHRANLSGIRRSLSPPSGHTEVHGKVERSRKRGALLFGVLLVIFLMAVWYWQDPHAGISQMIDTGMKKFLHSITREEQDSADVIETPSVEASTAIDAQVPDERNLAVPEPNFSENQEAVEIDTQSYEVLVFDIPVPIPPPPPPQEESGEATADVADPDAGSAGATAAVDGTADVAGSGTGAPAEDLAASSEPPSGEPVEDVAAPVAAQPEPAPEPAPAGESGASAVDDRIVFQVSKESWIDVRDSTGERLIYRTVNRGEDIRLRGVPPYSVFIGSAEGVRVEYRGKEVPFEAHESGLFARFEVGVQ